MYLNEFNNIYLSKLLDIILKENKAVFLLGDFNINLLKYEKHHPTNRFFHSLSSNMFLPYVFHSLSLITYFPINIIKRQFLVT